MLRIRLIAGLLLIGLVPGLAQRLVWTEWGWQVVPISIHLSGDGQVVYAGTVTVHSEYVIVRWRVGEGWWYLRADGSLTRNPDEAWKGSSGPYVKGVSYDGRVIVGGARDPQGRYRAFRWRLGRGVEWLQMPAGAAACWAVDVSADGNIVAGHVAVREGYEVWYLARWFADGHLGIIPNSRELVMTAMSENGRVIVGEDFNYYIPRPFRWVEGRGVEYPFGDVPRDISFDGRVVVGDGMFAYRWVEGVGSEQLVPFPHYLSVVRSVSWDGRMVVGGYALHEEGGGGPFVWREGVGFADLYEAYAGLWPDWIEWLSVYDLSADGRYMIGFGGRDEVVWLFWLDTGRLGDVDGNGCVDDGDLLGVLFNFGASGMNLRGDLNRDGAVDETDLLEVLLHFGEGC